MQPFFFQLLKLIDLLPSSYIAPVRRIGDKALPTIPNEIYSEIFENIQSEISEYYYKAFLDRTARVCRLFNLVASQHILKSIRLSGRPSEANTAPYLSNLTRQIAMNEEPGISNALFVKDCIVRDFQERNQENCAALSLQTTALAHMINIRSLTILYTPLTNEQLSAFSNIANLEFLILVDCRMSENIPSAVVCLGKLVKPVSVETIYRKEPDSFEFAKDIVSQSYNPVIEELYLEFNDREFMLLFGETVTDLVERILPRCPSLKRLAFYQLPMPEKSLINFIFGAATYSLPSNSIFAACRFEKSRWQVRV
ncbi:hypothetical protein SERLA73DRAFT_161410 [Serpula lacrymans var. lacrymans S7.3]|uniref:F-box domain-containing protein n=2 Tax=Serpula lacrymans var. lacrymans TaxID=341189 RepID=F8Q297_SERL3|nr:uncharacterized protein SERLADRAFT_416462 [Serpula lacrymans var. lacrymans S7.9]EGN97308.1 hypothetical protein SERLA73DRAFT_161410 [Serpula lacrymans var. lacrymans S7.3]EGO22896.1 hypothetical protein SERLADRAFT_416462 [Serpula lacrymans var. lacrymans S7.9]